MKTPLAALSTSTSALALSFLLVGCAHELSHEKTTSVSSTGAVKSKEKTVTESSNGTVTKTEEKKTTAPYKP
jgi:hypothetical protein